MTKLLEEAIAKIIQKDHRYHRDAYQFVREALDYTHDTAEKKSKAEARHVSGQQLLEGIRSCGLERFGPMAQIVFNEWGIRTCEDFGEVVFNMVESNLLAKTAEDSREDFKSGYSFFEAFRRPFLPARETAAPQPEPKSTKV